MRIYRMEQRTTPNGEPIVRWFSRKAEAQAVARRARSAGRDARVHELTFPATREAVADLLSHADANPVALAGLVTVIEVSR